jgi:hypothetical protein
MHLLLENERYRVSPTRLFESRLLYAEISDLGLTIFFANMTVSSALIFMP